MNETLVYYNNGITFKDTKIFIDPCTKKEFAIITTPVNAKKLSHKRIITTPITKFILGISPSKSSILFLSEKKKISVGGIDITFFSSGATPGSVCVKISAGKKSFLYFSIFSLKKSQFTIPFNADLEADYAIFNGDFIKPFDNSGIDREKIIEDILNILEKSEAIPKVVISESFGIPHEIMYYFNSKETLFASQKIFSNLNVLSKHGFKFKARVEPFKNNPFKILFTTQKEFQKLFSKDNNRFITIGFDNLMNYDIKFPLFNRACLSEMEEVIRKGKFKKVIIVTENKKKFSSYFKHDASSSIFFISPGCTTTQYSFSL